jgi:hypothetical protein
MIKCLYSIGDFKIFTVQILFLQIKKNYARYTGQIWKHDRLTIADKIDSMNRMKLQLHMHRFVKMFWKKGAYFSKNLRIRFRFLD